MSIKVSSGVFRGEVIGYIYPVKHLGYGLISHRSLLLQIRGLVEYVPVMNCRVAQGAITGV